MRHIREKIVVVAATIFAFVFFQNFVSPEQVQSKVDFHKIYEEHKRTMLSVGRYENTPYFKSIIQIKKGEIKEGVSRSYAYRSINLVGYSNGERRALHGTNLFFESPLLQIYNSNDSNDIAYKQAAIDYIRAYAARSSTRMNANDPELKEGLFLHGNHLFFVPGSNEFEHTSTEHDEEGTLDRDKVFHEINDYYGNFWKVFPIMHEADPAMTRQYAESIWKRHVFSHDVVGANVFDGGISSRYGQWDRHDQSNESKRHKTDGSSWSVAYIHAASAFLRVFTFMASVSKTPEEKLVWRKRAAAIRNYVWQHHKKIGTKTRDGVLIPYIVRRDFGRMDPIKDLGWKKEVWDSTAPSIPLDSKGTIQAYLDSNVCTSDGFARYNFPIIFRDPDFPNDASRINPRAGIPALLKETWRFCVQNPLVTAFYVPALIAAGEEFDDQHYDQMAYAIMKGEYRTSRIQRANQDVALVGWHHLFDKGDDLTRRSRDAAACIAAGPSKDCSALNSSIGVQTHGVSYPDQIPVDSLWDTDMSGEKNLLLGSRGYRSLASSRLPCEFCEQALSELTHKMKLGKSTKVQLRLVSSTFGNQRPLTYECPDVQTGDKRKTTNLEYNRATKIFECSTWVTHYEREMGTYAWLYAEGIDLLLDLNKIKSDARIHAEAVTLGEEAVGHLYAPEAQILRGHHLASYEATMGPDMLALAFKRLAATEEKEKQ